MAYMDPWFKARRCTHCQHPLQYEGKCWQCGCPGVQVSDLNLMGGMEPLPPGWRPLLRMKSERTQE